MLEVPELAGADPAADPTAEKLLATVRRDPDKLIAIGPLVADLAADDALPPGFAELWADIHAIACAGDGSP